MYWKLNSLGGDCVIWFDILKQTWEGQWIERGSERIETNQRASRRRGESEQCDATVNSSRRRELRQQRMMTTEEALICRPAFLSRSLSLTHTQHSDCSSLFLSPFGFLPACCLATRTPAPPPWSACDSPGAATSPARSRRVIRRQTCTYALLQWRWHHTNAKCCISYQTRMITSSTQHTPAYATPVRVLGQACVLVLLGSSPCPCLLCVYTYIFRS